MDTITILHELILKHESIVSELISALLEILESRKFLLIDLQLDIRQSAPSDEDETGLDIESLIHRFHVISNLLFANDGIGTQVPGWMKRIQDLVLFCNDEARRIRDNLYFDLESSYFISNDFMDVPIVSDEQ